MDLLFIFAWIMMFILVGIMADARDRDILGWCITSIFVSPFFAALFLLALGDSRR